MTESVSGLSSLGQPTTIQQLIRPVRVRRPQGKALEICRLIVQKHQGPRLLGKCALCPSPWEEVDHIDNNIANNDPDNLRGLCKPCNIRQRNLTAKNSGDTTGLDSVSVSVRGEEDSLAKNRRCEPAWVEYVTGWLRNLVSAPLLEVVTNNSALDIGISVYTVKQRYWPKWACESGPFRIFRPEGSTVELVELRKRPNNGGGHS